MKKNHFLAFIVSISLLMVGCEKLPDYETNNKQISLTDVKLESQSKEDSSIQKTDAYETVYSESGAGNGLIHKHLLEKGAKFTKNTSDHDSYYVDTSNFSESELFEKISNLKKERKPIIIDGSVDQKDSDKINRVIQQIFGMSVSGISSYAIATDINNKNYNIIPLLSIANEKGELNVNQLKSYFIKQTSDD